MLLTSKMKVGVLPRVPMFRMVGRAVMPRSRKPSEPPGCVGAIPTPSAILEFPKRKESHETHSALPKPIALSQELQTESCHANPAIAAVEPRVPASEPVWRQTAINHRLVAQ